MRGIRRNVLRIVQQLQPERVLDVCCGTGDQLRLLQREGIQAVGIDISKAMLRVASRGKAPARCLAQDATAMAFRDGRFDLAMVSFALHETEWQKAGRILDEIHRILKPGAYLLIVDYAFDEQTGSMAKAVIHSIEFMAGARHFANFRTFLGKGGLTQLIHPGKFRRLQAPVQNLVEQR